MPPFFTNIQGILPVTPEKKATKVSKKANKVSKKAASEEVVAMPPVTPSKKRPASDGYATPPRTTAKKIRLRMTPTGSDENSGDSKTPIKATNEELVGLETPSPTVKMPIRIKLSKSSSPSINGSVVVKTTVSEVPAPKKRTSIRFTNSASNSEAGDGEHGNDPFVDHPIVTQPIVDQPVADHSIVEQSVVDQPDVQQPWDYVPFCRTFRNSPEFFGIKDTKKQERDHSPSPSPKRQIWSNPNPRTGQYDANHPMFRLNGYPIPANDGIEKKLFINRAYRHIVWTGKTAQRQLKEQIRKYDKVRYFWITEDNGAHFPGCDDVCRSTGILYSEELASVWVQDWFYKLVGPWDFQRVMFWREEYMEGRLA